MCAQLPMKSQRGSSLISIMMAIGLMGLATFGILSWNSQKAIASRQMNVHAVADQMKQKLVGAVISPNSWQITQARNTGAFSSPIFAQTGGTNGSSNSYPSLDIYLAGSSNVYYQATNRNAGFDIRGVPCQGFEAEKGNDACPFRYDVKLVRHVFQNGNWIDTVRFELQFRPATAKYVFNAKQSQYTFDLVRNLDERSVESSCIALNGQYNVATGECSVRITNATSCNQDTTAYRGPATSNTGSCETSRTSSLACSAGQVIKGFDNRGYPQCASI